jgi:hypothetical protein
MIQKLDCADLVVDHVYGGSRSGNASDDPLPKLLGLDSGAGIRHLGQRPAVKTLKLVALKSSQKELDWPNRLNSDTGIFTYYGDRRTPGDIHDTPRAGNLILRNLFDVAHNPNHNEHFPPIFVFENTGVYRDVRFLGLAVPGADSLSEDDDLVAIWRSTGAESLRFQNYRANFTILNVPTITRAWINDVQRGVNVASPHVPEVWRNWVQKREYDALRAPRTIETRSKHEQLPHSQHAKKLLKLIRHRFADNPYAFEACAMDIARLAVPGIVSWELTRPWRDGGRDAVGKLRLGPDVGFVDVDFALEAKCFDTSAGVGVKPLSRLISRLRHRQFGILVTTSYLSDQAYRELKDDKHPVIVISGTDIAHILYERIGDEKKIELWLSSYPT